MRQPSLFFAALALLAAQAAHAAVQPATPVPAASLAMPEGFVLGGDAPRGKAIYGGRCSLCHGATGDGKGRMAQNEGKPPADFTDGALMAKRSDWEIYLAVRDGGPAIGLSPKMFGWSKLLNDQQIRDVAAFVRSLARRR